VAIKQQLIARGITPYGTDGEEAEISDIDVESEPVDEELPAENGGDA
jgi:hypothetical protein